MRDNTEGKSPVPPTPRTEWLEELLSENSNDWTIVVFHHPVFASRPGRDNPSVREQWKPLFDEYQVDLVLQGHDHSYHRSVAESHKYEYRFENGDEEGIDHFDPSSGTVYVSSMAGSKQCPLEPPHQRKYHHVQTNIP